MRAEVFTSFGSLLTGVLIGEAKAGTACASVLAPAHYWPQRLSDLFCRHKFSGQALMAHLAAVALTYLYPHGLPERLFWIADATYTEKSYAQHVASVDWFHRLKYMAGRAKNLTGHCDVFAAHLYPISEENRRQWASISRCVIPRLVSFRKPGTTVLIESRREQGVCYLCERYNHQGEKEKG